MSRNEGSEEKKKRLKKKIGMGILAGLTSVSVLLGGIYDSPGELVRDNHERPKILTENFQDFSEDELESEENEGKEGFKEKMKKQIYKIPVKVRAVFCVPLWALGTLILSGLNLLWKGIFTPLADVILNFLLSFLLLLGVLAVCIKLLFPDMPWRKIFSKKVLLTVFIGCLVMAVMDSVVPLFWKDYIFYRNLGKFILGLIVLTIIIRPFVKKKIEDMNAVEIRYEI